MGSAMDGFRKHLAYVFNLKGNTRTSGELGRKKGKNVFGQGSRASIAITLLIRHQDCRVEETRIYYHDIGDYLSREVKLEKIKSFDSVCNPDMEWETIHPNEAGDWINQRNQVFASYYLPGDKRGEESDKAVFVSRYSNGLKTNRDAWCYNSAKTELQKNIQQSIAFYTSQVEAFSKAKISRSGLRAEDFVTYDFHNIQLVR